MSRLAINTISHSAKQRRRCAVGTGGNWDEPNAQQERRGVPLGGGLDDKIFIGAANRHCDFTARQGVGSAIPSLVDYGGRGELLMLHQGLEKADCLAGGIAVQYHLVLSN